MEICTKLIHQSCIKLIQILNEKKKTRGTFEMDGMEEVEFLSS
jgi:hypothetical protein